MSRTTHPRPPKKVRPPAPAVKSRKPKQKKCACGYPIAESETWCGECLCEDDCAP